MAKKLVPVAMEQEIDHTACEVCETCGGQAAYTEALLSALRDLGAPNPEDLIARNDQATCAAPARPACRLATRGIIIGLSGGSDPTSYTPRYQLEEGSRGVRRGLARGQARLRGPTKDYEEARIQAEQGRVVRSARARRAMPTGGGYDAGEVADFAAAIPFPSFFAQSADYARVDTGLEAAARAAGGQAYNSRDALCVERRRRDGRTSTWSRIPTRARVSVLTSVRQGDESRGVRSGKLRWENDGDNSAGSVYAEGG